MKTLFLIFRAVIALPLVMIILLPFPVLVICGIILDIISPQMSGMTERIIERFQAEGKAYAGC